MTWIHGNLRTATDHLRWINRHKQRNDRLIGVETERKEGDFLA